jgi:hypothetical protein
VCARGHSSGPRQQFLRRLEVGNPQGQPPAAKGNASRIAPSSPAHDSRRVIYPLTLKVSTLYRWPKYCAWTFSASSSVFMMVLMNSKKSFRFSTRAPWHVRAQFFGASHLSFRLSGRVCAFSRFDPFGTALESQILLSNAVPIHFSGIIFTRYVVIAAGTDWNVTVTCTSVAALIVAIGRGVPAVSTCDMHTGLVEPQGFVPQRYTKDGVPYGDVPSRERSALPGPCLPSLMPRPLPPCLPRP